MIKKISVALILILAALVVYNNQETLPETVRETTEQIGLPFKMATLAAREPDAKILMPVAGVKVKGVSDTWQAPRGAATRRARYFRP